jgi:hypothetical protein
VLENGNINSDMDYHWVFVLGCCNWFHFWYFYDKRLKYTIIIFTKIQTVIIIVTKEIAYGKRNQQSKSQRQ